jgi:molybdopterin-containing oxidoreductase family membrane subunit
LAALLPIVGLGIFAYSRQYAQGEVITGMRDIGPMGGAPWGIYVVFMIFSMGVGVAGISVAALVRVFHMHTLIPLVRMAGVLSIVALLLDLAAIIADLGQPIRGMINLMRYGRLQSPFFGTMSLSIAYLMAATLYLYLDGKRDAALCARVSGRLQWFYRIWAAGYQDTPEQRETHDKAAFWLAVAILVLVVVYHATLGFVFGLQVARPGWFTPLLALWHLTLNAVSGIGGVLILVSAAVRLTLGARDQLPTRIFGLLGNFMMIFIAAFLFVLAVEVMTSTYEAPPAELRATLALLTGPYEWITWLSISFLGLAFLQLFIHFAIRRYKLSGIVFSAALVTAATFLQR